MILGAEVGDGAGVYINVHVILGVVGVELDLIDLTAVVPVLVAFCEGRIGGPVWTAEMCYINQINGIMPALIWIWSADQLLD